MIDRDDELLRFYRERRIDDQIRFYRTRRDAFDNAATQVGLVSATLLGFGTATAALAGTAVGPAWLWAVFATVIPAVVAAVTAYAALYAFERQSKLYADATRATRAAARAEVDPSGASVADLVEGVEATLRAEQAQWGQLTTDIPVTDQPPEGSP